MCATHLTMVRHSRAKHSMTVKGQKKLWPETKPCHEPYKFDLEIKGQCYIRIMNV